MSTCEEIISAALSLPSSTRAMLAEHLLESLDAEDQKRIDALWAEEAERRNKEIGGRCSSADSGRRSDK
jgi:hypothetical protein